MSKIFPLYRQNSGCDYHRVRLPFMHPADYVNHQFYNDFTLENADHYYNNTELFVYNRTFPLGVEKLKELRAKTGSKFVCDIDDWWVLNPGHPLFESYRIWIGQMIIDNIKLADLVTVTTARLAEKVRPYNKNVDIIPNTLPYNYGQFKEGLKGNAFVYTGQHTHMRDVMLLEGALNNMKDVDLTFHLAGYVDVEPYHKMEEVFSKAKNYKRIEQLPLDEYMQSYDGAFCALVPLLNNSFNHHKSNLKVLEAAARKIPAIVSHAPPYSDDKDAPVLWVKDKSDWMKHIKAIHESEAMREDYGNALFEWANEKYNLLKWNDYRFEAYKNILKCQ